MCDQQTDGLRKAIKRRSQMRVQQPLENPCKYRLLLSPLSYSIVERVEGLSKLAVQQPLYDAFGLLPPPLLLLRHALFPDTLRVRQLISKLISPLTKNTPNTQDANSCGDKPPRVPTANITATGPVAAKIKPISALAA